MRVARPPQVNRVLAVTAWALAAVVAGVVAWSAVAVIGDQAGASPEGVLSPAQVTGLLAARTVPGQGPTSPTEGRAPAATPGLDASASPASSAAGEPASPAAAEVVRNWTVPGGRVGAACIGDRIRLLFATPDAGWAVEVKATGPEDVEIELKRGEAETKVHAACLSGAPDLTSAVED